MISALGKKNTLEEWEDFISIIKGNPSARKATLEAWERCRYLGLEPNKVKFEFLSDEELQQKIKENLQLKEIAKPYIDSLVINLAGMPHTVVLSDSEGWIIEFKGILEDVDGRAMGFCLGSNLSEKNIGNNGIGTALATGRSVLVYAGEHYGGIYNESVCIGVPVENSNGDIMGAIGICIPCQYTYTARLLIAYVNSIEAAITYNNSSINISSDGQISEKNELISTLVHDLKNPLAIIRGLGQLGKITSDKSKINNYFNRIIKQVDEMNNMLIELLSIFKPEQLMPQKIVSIIEEVLHSFKPICDSRNIKLCLIDNADEYVNMSERLLKRAIENLINNAVQVMEEGGMIEVKTELDGDSILILIKDTAGGIPTEIRETLFEPFSFRRSGGTGLGLFMVYNTITDIHKGKIWFETELNQGTKFFIKLPLA